MTDVSLLARRLAVASSIVLAGCTATLQRPAIEAATANDEARAEAFEATLRVLDDNPRYVDEFFLLARKSHPPTLERFIENTAREARDPELATRLAARLVQHPASLEEIQVRTLEAAREEPDARAAMARAIQRVPEVGATAVAEHPDALRIVSRAAVEAILARPDARRAFLASMQDLAIPMADLLVDNPETLSALIEAVLERGGVGVVKDLVGEAVSGKDSD